MILLRCVECRHRLAMSFLSEPPEPPPGVDSEDTLVKSLATANDELPEHVNILFLQTVEQSDLPYDAVSDLSICLSVHLSNACDS